MPKGPQGRLLACAYLAARLSTTLIALAGLLALLVFHRLTPWVFRTWEWALVALAATSVVLYVFVARRRTNAQGT